MQMNEQIDIIIAKKLSGETSEEDMRILEAWLNEDSNHKAEYERIVQIWNDSDTLFSTPDFNVNAAWDKVAAQTVGNRSAAAQRKTIDLSAWMRYAIAAAAILLIGIFVIRQYTSHQIQVVVADASNKEITLPDQSHITLRKGSKISYPETFAENERDVTLEGEAFFQVVHNEHQPFVVNAQSVSVKVLGTSFNVQCGKESANVTVATGRVQVTSHEHSTQYVILTKGESGRLDNGKLTEGVTEGNNYLFWKTGILQYDNKSLSYIVNELNHYYQKKIIIDSSVTAAVKDQLITISFNNQPLDKVLTELCLVAQCKWQQKDDQYIIVAK